MTNTVGTNLVKSKQLLIETSIVVEDILDVSTTMLDVWKGNNEREKKNLGSGLKQLIMSSISYMSTLLVVLVFGNMISFRL
jgi:hypothetical protein